MKRFGVVVSVWAMGLAGMLGGLAPASASVPLPPLAQATAVSTPGGFMSLTPSRLLNTLDGVGAPKAAVAASGTVHLQVTGRGGVPVSGISAVVLNVAVVAPTSAGYITVYGAGTTRPGASNLNFVKAQTVPNLVIAPVGAGGVVDLYNGSNGTVQLVADVSGYFLSGTPEVAGAFGSLAPSRLLNTLAGVGAPKVAVAAGGTVHLQVTGRGGVPASGVSAVVLNVATVAPTSAGYITVYGAGATLPTASNLNFVKGQTVPNLVIAPVGAGGVVDLYNGSNGTVQLVADVSGYFLSGTPTAMGAFGSLAPSRLLNTLAGVGAPKVAVAAGGTVHLQVTGRGGVPATGVSAAVLNVATVAPTSAGYITVYGAGTTRPGASNLNFVKGQTVPNLVIAPVGANGMVDLYNGSNGTVQLVADVAGYFLDTTPGPVTNVTGTPTATSIALSWTNPTTASLTGVMIRRALGATAPDSATAGTLVAEVAAPTTSFTDTALTPGDQYSYAFFAHESTPSYAAAATVTSTTLPGPVTNVTATAASTSIALSWTNPAAASLTGVTIRRAPGGTAPDSATAGTLVAEAAAPTTSFTDTALTPGDQYSYALFAHDGTPSYGAAATVTSTTIAGPVTNVSATVATDSIDLSWTNPAAASLTGVMIRRALGAIAPDSAGAGTLVAEVATPMTSFTDTKLAAGTRYSYALFAHDGTPVYALAGTVTATTTPGPVTNSTATPASTSITLSWANPTTASLTGVMIRRALGATAPASATAGTLVTDAAATTTSFTDTGLALGTQYSYALFAHDAMPGYATADTVDSTTTGGTAWAWGRNDWGQLGGGSSTDSSTASLVSNDIDWVSVSAGDIHTVGVKTDGTLWAWGYNGSGQLGDGTTNWRSAPVHVGTHVDWASVSAGNVHTSAVKTDGTLWAWGWNQFGQLGDGTTTNRSTPAQVGTDNHWSSVAAGNNYTMAIKTDGTLWAWGYNGSGQLGDGTTTNRTNPVQVGIDDHWASVVVSVSGAHTAGVKTDGSLWAWGGNASGQLGDGTTTSRSTPGQVGNDTNWATASAGFNYTMVVKTDGSLWGWGNNSFGQLGDGSTTGQSVPVMIGTDTSWVSVSAGRRHTVAVKTDSTVWTWGNNSSGQLGDGTTTSRSVPVVVGTDTHWALVAAGGYHTVALQP